MIHALEDQKPTGRERIDWKLVTDLPVESMHGAIEKLDWYSMRWKIETFHKILKSGCKAENSNLRTAERLTNLLAIYCILSWRIFCLCMVNRADPEAPASMVFTETELHIMDALLQQTAPIRQDLALPQCRGTAGRLLGSQRRPASWEHGPLAGIRSLDRHPPRLRSRCATCG